MSRPNQELSSESADRARAQGRVLAASVSRRQVLGKLQYVPPAVLTLGALQPQVALGNSGPSGTKPPGRPRPPAQPEPTATSQPTQQPPNQPTERPRFPNQPQPTVQAIVQQPPVGGVVERPRAVVQPVNQGPSTNGAINVTTLPNTGGGPALGGDRELVALVTFGLSAAAGVGGILRRQKGQGERPSSN